MFAGWPFLAMLIHDSPTRICGTSKSSERKVIGTFPLSPIVWLYALTMLGLRRSQVAVRRPSTSVFGRTSMESIASVMAGVGSKAGLDHCVSGVHVVMLFAA